MPILAGTKTGVYDTTIILRLENASALIENRNLHVMSIPGHQLYNCNMLFAYVAAVTK